MISDQLQKLLRGEAATGLLLLCAAILALALANSPAAWFYGQLIDMPVVVRVGGLELAKPLLLWINDGLMALFFFLVGLELKHEMLHGELANPRQVMLPALGAAGGMLVPALIYVLVNRHDAGALNGWAIPTATDIAFVLGILGLLGSRVPPALKVFVVSLAIFDDLGAIVIIALFYTGDISGLALALSGAGLLALWGLNRLGVARLTPYLLLGLLIWLAVLKSGVHATLAGVAVALFIPDRDRAQPEHSPLHQLAEDLRATVYWFILPLFAFANSGIAVQQLGLDILAHPVPLGIALGLFLGKPLGVMLWCGLAIRWGLASLPRGATWSSFFGVAMLCGVGFTMSLFIGSLAFEQSGDNLLFDERLGILLGSLLSATLGWWWLRRTLPPETQG